jgi:hypothetical protein
MTPIIPEQLIEERERYDFIEKLVRCDTHLYRVIDS